MVSDEQQRAIDVRRQWVARHHLRGLSVRQIHAQLAGMTATDPQTGLKTPVCRNPETGQPWCVATVGLDVQAAREGWKAGVSREVEERKAQVDAHLAEMRRIAYATNDMKALNNALKQEREMFGLDASKRSEVSHEEKQTEVVPNNDDRFADAATVVARKYGIAR